MSRSCADRSVFSKLSAVFAIDCFVAPSRNCTNSLRRRESSSLFHRARRYPAELERPEAIAAENQHHRHCCSSGGHGR
jgi:hypothetical protein